MNRYFDLLENKTTLEVNVDIGSDAQYATPTEIAHAFGYVGEVREVERAEYLRLKRVYSRVEEP